MKTTSDSVQPATETSKQSTWAPQKGDWSCQSSNAHEKNDDKKQPCSSCESLSPSATSLKWSTSNVLFRLTEENISVILKLK